MDLPLILAGPILRRIEPNLVSVWLALSEAASVQLTLWEGRATADQPSRPNTPPRRQTAHRRRHAENLRSIRPDVIAGPRLLV